MKKSGLLVLNALLAGLLVLGAAELYARYLEAEQRLARLDVVAPDAVPPTTPVPARRPATRCRRRLPAST